MLEEVKEQAGRRNIKIIGIAPSNASANLFEKEYRKTTSEIVLKGFDKAKEGSKMKEVYQSQIRLYAQENRVIPQEQKNLVQQQNKTTTPTMEKSR